MMSSPLKKTFNIVVNNTSVLPLVKWQTKRQRDWHDLATKTREDYSKWSREEEGISRGEGRRLGREEEGISRGEGRRLGREDERRGRRDDKRGNDERRGRTPRRHDSAQLCQSYLEQGHCREERRCRYAHSMEAVRRGRRDERRGSMSSSSKVTEASKVETVVALKKKLAVLEEVIRAKGLQDKEMGVRSKSVGHYPSGKEMKTAKAEDKVPGRGDGKTVDWILQKRKVRSMSAVRNTGRSMSTARSLGRDNTLR